MKVDIDVNGIEVEFLMNDIFKKQDEGLHTLLRRGDECEVNDGGVRFKGRVENIIRLSKGKWLFSVSLYNNMMKEAELYEDYQVTPVDPEQCALRITAMDMLLRKYEPKGMSTNVGIWQ